MTKNTASSLLAEGERYLKLQRWAHRVRPRVTPSHGGISEALTDSSQKGIPEALAETIRRSQAALLGMQNTEEGYWCGPIFGDTTIDSDTVMLLNFLGRGGSSKVQGIAEYLLDKQNPDGGWPIFANGPSEVSATVKAYWALKFAGHAPDEPRMKAARKRIAALGSIHKVNTYTRFYLALFGQYDWRGVPAIPPEIVLLPEWFYFNLYEMSAWTRPIVVPLSIVWALRPSVLCPPHATLEELFPDDRRYVPLSDAVASHGMSPWTKLFLLCDSFLKGIEGRTGQALRRRALRQAEDWILARLPGSDGPGAIFPPIINTIVAMKCLGYADTDPRLVTVLEELDRLEIPEEGRTRYQPTRSPVWDTALSVIALAESGVEPADPSLVRACRWLVSKEIKVRGDWAVANPDGPTGGWHFQFNNVFYPDVDDTAMVLLALRHVGIEGPDAQLREEAFLRGLLWILSMQSSTGGWGAFDKENSKEVLTRIPFADHNAMIDPPTADITARVLELFGYVGCDTSYGPVAKAVRFLKKEQEPDGSWYGRWGVNYLYGTWQVLRGLSAVGEDLRQPCVQRAVSWLKSVQHKDGGWGETCETYENPGLKGRGPTTPAQTAWALMGLMAAGVFDDSVRRGIACLTLTQRPDGTWDETEFTGTGFPKVYYLEYTMYRNYFPLQALGNYRKALIEGRAHP